MSFPKIEVVKEIYRQRAKAVQDAQDRYLFDRYTRVHEDQKSIRESIADSIQRALNQQEPITHITFTRHNMYEDAGSVIAMIKIFGPELEAAGYRVHLVDGGMRIDWLHQVEQEGEVS